MQDDDNSTSASAPTTPPPQSAIANFASELSPPDSQQLHPTAPANAPSPFTPLPGGKANANTSKKMPLNANGKRTLDEPPKMKGEEGGYQWDKEEDAPGYSWQNSKAREEAARAWQGVQEKDRRIGNKYGDVLLPGK